MRTKLLIILITCLLTWPSDPSAEMSKPAVDSATHTGAELSGVSGGQETFLLDLDSELALSTSAKGLLDDLPPWWYDWLYWEWENRSGYDILVPDFTYGWWRELFLFTALDDFETRVDRYRQAFVVALMQPELTARVKTEAYLSSELKHLVDLTLSISDLDGDLLDLLNVLKNGGNYLLNPAQIEITLDEWQGFLANEYLNGSLASLGGALGDVSFIATLTSDALGEMFLHSIANSQVLERMVAFDDVFQQCPPDDPAMFEGYELAKDDVNDFLNKHFNAFEAVINSFDVTDIIEVGDLLLELAVQFNIIAPTLAASILSGAYPYLLAIPIGWQILTETEQMQVICADATINDWLVNNVRLEYQLPDPTSPDYPDARRTYLNVNQVRYGLAYSARNKFDEILDVNHMSPLVWIKFLVQIIAGSWDDISEFRTEILQYSMEKNLGWAIEISEYLQYDTKQPPQVVSHVAGSNINTNIYITFNKDLNQETCNNSTISVVGSQSGTHSNSFVFDHSEYKLTIDPDSDFSYDDEVAVNISTGVQDLAGNGLDDPYYFTFQIGSAPGYVVAAWAGQNGSVSPDEPQIVTQSGSIEFLADPSDGYEVDQWFLDGIVDQEGGNTYTIPDVQSCHFVVVTFRLASGGEITVTSPNGGEVFALQSKMPITWSWSGDVGDNVKIQLYRGGIVEKTIEPSIINNGSISWKVEYDTPLASSYRIKVSSLSSAASDSSDGEFEIVDSIVIPPEIPIYTIQDLQDICDGGENPIDGHYVLMNDIDASGFPFQPIGTGYDNYFYGVLDGNRYSINRLTIELASSDYVGLFSVIQRHGERFGVVKNLSLTDFYVEGDDYVGAFAGTNKGRIVNCHAKSNSEEAWLGGNTKIGGIAGANDGTIRNCTVTRTLMHDLVVYAEQQPVGGIAGASGESGTSDAIIEFCSTSCFVEGMDGHAGGIAGWNFDIIRECGYQGFVSGHYDRNGGMVGWGQGGVIENCYFDSSGQLLGRWENGGIVGRLDGGGSVNRCYAAGSISGNTKGGLGGTNNGTISNCFWDTQKTGCSNPIVDGSDPVNSHGKTTAQMKQQTTFTTEHSTFWDFDTVWAIDNGNDYPRLRGAGVALLAPEGLTASTDLPDGVHVSWDSVTYHLAGNTHEAVYRAYRSDEPDGETGMEELRGWHPDRDLIDSTAAPEESYYYWVGAAATAKGARESDFSGPAFGKRTQPPSPTPSELDATDGLTQLILIEWDAYDANYYRVYRSTSPEGDKTPISSWQTRTSFVDTLAGKGTEYFYWVGAALNDTGFAESQPGEPDTGSFTILDESHPELSVHMTPASPIETQVGTLYVSASDNDILKQITLHWSRGEDSTQTWDEIGAQSCSLTHVIGVLSAADSITYWAEAWDSTDNRTESEHICLIVGEEGVTVPSRPEGPHCLQANELGQYVTGSCTTSLGSPVQYSFDWGDGSQSDWSDSVDSKSWPSDGMYFVKVQARSQPNPSCVSRWSYSLPVIVDTCSPTVEITTNDGMDTTVCCPLLTLMGQARESAVSSGIEVTTVSSGESNDGDAYDWSFTVLLTEGENQLIVSSTDKVGNTGYDTINVVYGYGPVVLPFSGVVFWDSLGDSVPIPNKAIQLWTDAEALCNVDTTDEDGFYLLRPVSSGNYCFRLAPYDTCVYEIDIDFFDTVTVDSVSGMNICCDGPEGPPSSDVEEVPTSEVPQHFGLSQNYPNPFNPETRIEFSLARQSFVTIHICNILGQKIREIVSEQLPAGKWAISWDGRDARGYELASGVYFCRIRAGDFVDTKKMVLLR